jgi:hypothetical protein
MTYLFLQDLVLREPSLRPALIGYDTVIATRSTKEPAKRFFAADYMARRGLKSTGGIQRSLSALSAEDLVEQRPAEGPWAVVDPMLRQWLMEKAA